MAESAHGKRIIALYQAVQQVERMPVPTEEIPDTVGHLRNLEQRLADLRRRHLSELEGPAEGQSYRVVEERAAKRTYNDSAILAATGAAGMGIPDLVRAGVVRLGWQWTKLQHLFQKADIQLRIEGHEIENTGDVDGPHVGVVWETRQRIEGRKGDD